MKKILIQYLSVFMVFNLFSCSFLGEEIIEIPPQKSRIAMFAELFNDQEESQIVVLSRTRNFNEGIVWDVRKRDVLSYPQGGGAFLSPIELDSVSGARIKLTSNGRDVATFTQPDPLFKSFYESKIGRLEEGSKCKIQVSAPKFDSIFAEQTVPKTVKLAKAYFRRNSYQSLKTGTLCELFLEFDNDSATINFYAVDIFVKRVTTNDYYYYEPKLIKLDPNADTPKFLNSKNFNTKRYVWRIGIDIDNDFNYNPDGNPSKPIPKELLNLFVRFRSTAKDFNEYAKNLEAVNSAKDNLFGEPITPFNNVKNGYGVFVVSGKPDTLSLLLR